MRPPRLQFRLRVLPVLVVAVAVSLAMIVQGFNDRGLPPVSQGIIFITYALIGPMVVGPLLMTYRICTLGFSKLRYGDLLWAASGGLWVIALILFGIAGNNNRFAAIGEVLILFSIPFVFFAALFGLLRRQKDASWLHFTGLLLCLIHPVFEFMYLICIICANIGYL